MQLADHDCEAIPPRKMISDVICDMCDEPARLACGECQMAFYCGAKCEMLDVDHDIDECAHFDDMSESELAEEIKIARDLLGEDIENPKELFAKTYVIGKKGIIQKFRRKLRKRRRRRRFRKLIRGMRQTRRTTRRESRRTRRLFRRRKKEKNEESLPPDDGEYEDDFEKEPY